MGITEEIFWRPVLRIRSKQIYRMLVVMHYKEKKIKGISENYAYHLGLNYK